MKQFFRKTISGFLALSLACGLAMPAAASEALGDDLTVKETLLNEETQLSTNVFWSTAYSDLRTEHFITYTPNEDVLPVVTAGEVLTKKHIELLLRAERAGASLFGVHGGRIAAVEEDA